MSRETQFAGVYITGRNDSNEAARAPKEATDTSIFLIPWKSVVVSLVNLRISAHTRRSGGQDEAGEI